MMVHYSASKMYWAVILEALFLVIPRPFLTASLSVSLPFFAIRNRDTKSSAVLTAVVCSLSVTNTNLNPKTGFGAVLLAATDSRCGALKPW